MIWAIDRFIRLSEAKTAKIEVVGLVRNGQYSPKAAVRFIHSCFSVSRRAGAETGAPR